MGKPFTRQVRIRRSKTSRQVALRAIVDTGATYTLIPEDILDRLRVVRSHRKPMLLADGRSEYFDMGTCWIELDGFEGATPVVFGDSGSTPLLGCATLDDFGVGVDPVNERLIPVPLKQ